MVPTPASIASQAQTAKLGVCDHQGGTVKPKREAPAIVLLPRLGVWAGVRSKSQSQLITQLAKTTHRGGGVVFGVKPADRRQRIYVAGKTGSGKTTLLQNLAIPRMLSDDNFREVVLRRVGDPIIGNFWMDEYARYPESLRQEAIALIPDKVGRLLSNAHIRNIVGQVRGKIDLRFMMDDGRILIANLAKGRIGEDKANLLGFLLVSGFQHAALSRADQPEHARRDFHLTIDEFHNFSTERFESILAEARKYRLNLTLAHQYLEQLSEPIRAAVFGNVGTLLTFRVGSNDAEVFSREFFPVFSAEDLVNLDRYHVAMRLMIDGQPSRPFSAASLPLLQHAHQGHGDTVRRRSREKYARRRHDIEYKIARWMGGPENRP